MQDRPTAPELLEALREFLETDIAPDLDGRRRFHLRVAMNILSILEREWRGEERAVRAEYARLAALLGEPETPPGSFEQARGRVRELNERLAAAIAAGDLDDRFEEVRSALLDSAVDQLRIANPRWIEG